MKGGPFFFDGWTRVPCSEWKETMRRIEWFVEEWSELACGELSHLFSLCCRSGVDHFSMCCHSVVTRQSEISILSTVRNWRWHPHQERNHSLPHAVLFLFSQLLCIILFSFLLLTSIVPTTCLSYSILVSGMESPCQTPFLFCSLFLFSKMPETPQNVRRGTLESIIQKNNKVDKK